MDTTEVANFLDDWARRFPAIARSTGREPTDPTAQAKHDEWFYDWLATNKDITSTDARRAVELEFERRKREAEVARAEAEAEAEAAAQAAWVEQKQIDRQRAAWFIANEKEVGARDTPLRAAWDAWLDHEYKTGYVYDFDLVDDREDALRNWYEQGGYRTFTDAEARAAAKQAEKEAWKEEAARQARAAAEQAQQYFAAHVTDPVWCRGEDPTSMRAVAALWQMGCIKGDSTLMEPHLTTLSAERHQREEEIATATEQADANNRRRVALGEPPPIIPARVDLKAIVTEQVDGVARWLVAHEVRVGIGRWDKVRVEDTRIFSLRLTRPPFWNDLYCACVRWATWTELTAQADAEADPAIADVLRATATAIGTVQVLMLTGYGNVSFSIDSAVPDAAKLNTLLEMEHKTGRWEFEPDLPDAGANNKAARPKPQSRRQKGAEVAVMDAATATSQYFGRQNELPSGNRVEELMRKFGAKGKRSLLIAAYNEWAEENDGVPILGED